MAMVYTFDKQVKLAGDTEEMKKPRLSKERIIHWLTSFRSGDINDIEYRRRVIDTLVNSVYVYDTKFTKCNSHNIQTLAPYLDALQQM